MACDQNCGALFAQGGQMGCGGTMAGIGYQGAMDPSMGGMGYPGGWGTAVGTPMGYQQLGMQQGQLGYHPGQFEPGAGCGGMSTACGPQGADIPPQARARKPRPPSSNLPKRKVGTSYTTLATPLAGTKELTEEGAKDIPPDHERFDTLTLAFGTKPGTDKPPKILLTLKSPKVIDAKLGTGTAATQVHYRDLGLPDPNVKHEDAKSRASSRSSKKSKHSAKTSKTKRSKKTSKPKKGKK